MLRVSIVWEGLGHTYLRASVGSLSLAVPGENSVTDQ